MPGVLARYEPNSKTANAAGDAERRERIAMINAAWAYYNDGYTELPLKVKPGKINDNVIINLNAQAVDQSVAFFAPKPPEFVVPGGQTRQTDATGKLTVELSPEQEAIKTFLKANEFDEMIVDVALSGFLSGHSFVRLYPPDGDAPITPENPPRMALLDPRLVNVFWDMSDIKRVLWYRLTWEMVDDSGKKEYRRQDIVPAWLGRDLVVMDTEDDDEGEDDSPNDDSQAGQALPETVTWLIFEYESKNAEKWEVEGVDLWEYPFSPIVHWKNTYSPHEFYGRSDLRHTAISDAVNFMASNTARIIRFHAHPRTVAKGVDTSKIKETRIDGMWEIGDNGEITNLEMQSDLGSSLNYLEVLRRAYFAQMRVIDMSTIKDTVGALTNFGVQMMFKDMLDNIKTKRSVYGNGLARVVQNALIMMGFADVEQPEDKWPEPLPTNKLELVTALEKENALGIVSKQTMTEDLDRDPVVEAERMEQETATGADNTVDLLDKLGRSGGFNMFGGTSQRMPIAG